MTTDPINAMPAGANASSQLCSVMKGAPAGIAPILTPEHRAFFEREEPSGLIAQMIERLQERFGLTQLEALRLFREWNQERYRGMPVKFSKASAARVSRPLDSDHGASPPPEPATTEATAMERKS